MTHDKNLKVHGFGALTGECRTARATRFEGIDAPYKLSYIYPVLDGASAEDQAAASLRGPGKRTNQARRTWA